MKRLLLLVAFLFIGCSVPPSSSPSGAAAPVTPAVIYYHDATHSVGCWYNSYGMSCLPDSQYPQ